MSKMVKWIAILVVLVSLSGPSFSRSWVGFDDHDYFGSSLADTDSNESNRKARHYGDHGGWDSDEEDGDSEHQGFGYEDDKPNSSDEEHYGHDSEFSSHVDHGYNHGHHYHEKYGYNHHDYHDKDVHSQPGSNWGSYPYNQGHKHPETHIETPGHSHHQEHHGDQNKKPEPSSWGKIQNDLQQMLYTKLHANQRSGHHGSGQHSHHQGSHDGSSGWQNPQGSQKFGIAGTNDADRVVFPGSNNQISTTRRPATTTTQTTTRPSSTTSRTTSTTRAPTTTRPSTSTTRTTAINTALLNLVLCVRACPTTPEYNPVCGSNNITYNNPGALECARNCGINVSLARRAPCPLLSPSSTTTTTTSTTTRRPSTTTGRPQTLIPIDLLLSIFGQPSSPNTNTAKH